ncbi:MAG TPA: hypothetical protein GXX29_02010 [Firmicutes bacterium]|nr:hypothetical protein [Bacillota bacterium]
MNIRYVLCPLLIMLMLMAGFGLICAVAPAAEAFSINVGISSANQDPGEALLMAAASLFFDIDNNLAMRYRNDIGSSRAAISLFYIAAEAQVLPDELVLEKKTGKVRGWGALAKGKIPPGLTSKWKKGDLYSLDDEDFEISLNINFLAAYYAVPEDQVITWLRSGLSLTDIALCLNIAARANANPVSVVAARQKGQNWSQLCSQYKVPYEQLTQPVPPKKKHDKKVPSGPAKKSNK